MLVQPVSHYIKKGIQQIMVDKVKGVNCGVGGILTAPEEILKTISHQVSQSLKYGKHS